MTTTEVHDSVVGSERPDGPTGTLPTPVRRPNSARGHFVGLLARHRAELGWIAGIALAYALFANTYRLSIVILGLVYGIVLLGLDLELGFGGQLALATPAYMAMGAYGTAIGATEYDRPLLVGGGIGVAAAVLAALLVGRFALRVTGLALLLTTLFLVLITVQVVTNSDFFGATFGISGVPFLELGVFHMRTVEGQLVLVGTVFIVLLGVVGAIVRSDAGVQIAVASDCDQAAQAAGVRVRRRRIEIHVVSAVCAAVAGVLFAAANGYVYPEAFGLSVLFSWLVMLYVGGRRSLWGPAIGAVLIVFLPDLVESAADYIQVVEGVLLVLCIRLLPAGFAGLARRAAILIRDRMGHSTSDHEPATTHSGTPTRLTALAPVVRDRTDGDSDRPRPGAALVVEGVSKRFGGIVALDNLSFACPDAGVYAVIGPNGAGKTTLLNVLSGFYTPDAGSVHLAGRRLDGQAPERVAQQGVKRTFQTVQLSEHVSVLDNVAVAVEPWRASSVATAWCSPWRWRRQRLARELAYAKLDELGLAGAALRLPHELPLGTRRFVEFARATIVPPRCLLLDEPVSGMTAPQREQFGKLLQRAAATMVVVLIEHDMGFVRDNAQQVVACVNGRKLREGPTEEVLTSDDVRQAYLGTAGIQ